MNNATMIAVRRFIELQWKTDMDNQSTKSKTVMEFVKMKTGMRGIHEPDEETDRELTVAPAFGPS